jgi:hypothetical protein
MKRPLIIFFAAVALGVLAGLIFFSLTGREGSVPPSAVTGDQATGYVFLDENGNGSRDPGEPGVEGVRVSDQRTVTETDRDGRWGLPAHEAAVYFISKPRGYATPLDENNLPSFYYLHRETEPLPLAGSVVQTTGPLPESVDFPLVRQDEPDRFQVIIMGDPQPRDLDEVDYFARDVVEELVGTDVAFALTLGDIVFDAPELYPHMNGAMGTLGVPVYNTSGNHDANYDGLDPYQHYETWRTVYGPRYYSFDYGPVHFMVLGDVIFPEQGTRYVAGLGEDQLAWIEADLSYVPQETLVVLAMHIPLAPASENQDFARMYEILGDRPHTLSFSAHLHTLSQGFLGENLGWEGPTPHHHINAGATCGRWWGGAPDETEIPHATGSDGSPNGYLVATFEGTEYSTRFKPARRPDSYQMEVQAPDQVSLPGDPNSSVLVNVFHGGVDWTVEMAVGEDGSWTKMTYAPQPDPMYSRVAQRDSGQNGSLSYHIWEEPLPSSLPSGTHLIQIRATDTYGNQHHGSRILRVVESVPGDRHRPM